AETGDLRFEDLRSPERTQKETNPKHKTPIKTHEMKGNQTQRRITTYNKNPMNRRQRPTIGLALSGGAARGLAHIGVLRALSENNIPIDCLAGTSAGSIVGGAWAAGLSLEQTEAIGRSLRWRDVGRVTMSRLGVQSNERLEQFLRAQLPVT